MRNGEDLCQGDFESFEDLSLHQDDGCCNIESDVNKPNGIGFKTPCIKSLSNACCTPTMFSPSVAQDCNVQKGSVTSLFKN